MRGRRQSGLVFVVLLATTPWAAPVGAANVQVVVAPVLPKLIKGNLDDPSHMTFGLGG